MTTNKRKTRSSNRLATIKEHESVSLEATTFKSEELVNNLVTNDCNVDIVIKQEETNTKIENWSNPACTDFSSQENDFQVKDSSLNEVFNCTICNEPFASVSSCSIHMCQSHCKPTSPMIAKRDKTITPDPTNPNNYCRSCKRAYRSFRYYQRHLLYVHHFQSTHINLLEPQPGVIYQDTDNEKKCFCYRCQKSFSSNSVYVQHLYGSHQVKIFGKPQKLDTIPNITPDPNDPNFYCQSCNIRHILAGQYREHLRKIHHMKLTPLPLKLAQKWDSSIAPDINDPNSYCKACDKKYASLQRYRQHLRRIHKIVGKHGKRTENPTVKPDPNDPNQYCRSCNFTFLHQASFEGHLKKIHNMLPKSATKKAADKLLVDSNALYYCKACKKKYPNFDKYSEHLRLVHETNPKLSIEKQNLHIQPDPDDPNFYCKPCVSKYKSRSRFREHLRYVHKMVLPSLCRKNPNVDPDPNDPNLYCKSCDRKYPSLGKFRVHLRDVHKLNLKPLRRNPT